MSNNIVVEEGACETMDACAAEVAVWTPSGTCDVANCGVGSDPAELGSCSVSTCGDDDGQACAS